MDTVTQLERGLEKLELMVIMTCEHMETARSRSGGMEREEEQPQRSNSFASTMPVTKKEREKAESLRTE